MVGSSRAFEFEPALAIFASFAAIFSVGEVYCRYSRSVARHRRFSLSLFAPFVPFCGYSDSSFLCVFARGFSISVAVRLSSGNSASSIEKPLRSFPIVNLRC
jgi:hypothetical protein